MGGPVAGRVYRLVNCKYESAKENLGDDWEARALAAESRISTLVALLGESRAALTDALNGWSHYARRSLDGDDDFDRILKHRNIEYRIDLVLKEPGQ